MGILKNFVLAITVGCIASPAMSAERLDSESAFEQSQNAIGNLTGEHILRDYRSRDLALADLRGKPLVISLIFTSCATVCPIVTDHLRDSVKEARRILGDDSFNVLTFGFDASGDRPGQLAGFAGTHRLVSMDGWQIASASVETTEVFLAELGFSFAAAAGSFDHVTQTTILDADGRVYRQIYGEAFPLPVLLEPLKDLVLGRATRSIAPSDLWDRLTFLCTVYNPATGAYRFDYSIFFGIFFGAISLILMGWFVLRLWMERLRASRGGQISRKHEVT